MGLFQKLRKGLKKTSHSLGHEIRRIITLSPKLTKEGADDLEATLLAADLGPLMTRKIISATQKAYETQGKDQVDIFSIAAAEVRSAFSEKVSINEQSDSLTIISLVGVNGTGKTTTCAKLANRIRERGSRPLMAACDTFRAAAIDQLKDWSDRLDIPLISGNYGADPASIAHDAIAAALARGYDYLIIDTAGRLHTKHNLMKELEKLHRVVGKKLENAPHESLLILDATTGMNALNQVREFHRIVPLTGLIITKLDGTSKGGMIVSIQQEMGIPVKFIGVGEGVEDLHPFRAKEFAEALFSQ